MKKIAVIGAGVTGVTTAYSLMNRGFDVTVFDQNRYAAMDTSFANGGQLSASNAEVWNRWSTVFKGMKWMFKRGAPLLVNPKPSWHKYSWMAEFVANIPHYRQNTIDTVRLAIAARELLRTTAAKEGFAFDIEERGILHIYNTKKEYDHATEVNALLAEGGLTREAVTPEDIKKLEPAIKSDFYGGYYTASDATGDIHLYSRGLSEACRKKGVNFHFNADVTEITQKDCGHVVAWKDSKKLRHEAAFDGIVVCAGVGSRKFGKILGDRINVYPVKGYSITVKLDDEESQAAAPWVSLLDDEAKVVTSRLGKDRFRVAGTAEFNGYNWDIRDDRVRPLVKWVEDVFPDVQTEHAVPWAGLRPMMPNMVPIVAPGKRPGVYYNTGHGHLGWTLSAATAEIIADKILADYPQ
ncbi:D-amino acid dehydrogenase [Boseongicola aestuarii]|uniref:D-amino acid dehydrogenase small subunit n=1 Tax=Boseongicola aestuarii TaxID=1470561 RepID=A0A238J1Z2_9RHOB|nr:D-amino acid dehydrogenase [Boseongicola aestuarii]SMX24637.1 D-amino acid dehydrogenase small subunit [Boseongicola aestuarii]